jgi:Flp pilus assembly protein CpaB
VVATIRGSGINARAKVVTILQDVLVLAVDQTAVRQEDKQAYGQVSNALLAVKPADSQKVALAQSMGELRLVLRAHDDETRVPLPVVEANEPDSLAGDGLVSPSAASKPQFRLAVARADLEAGTTIDDPHKFFEVKTFAEAPPEAVPESTMSSIKGQKIKHTIFKDGVLTAKHFRGEEFTQVAAKPVEPKQLMFIQNGGQAPQVYAYGKDGYIVTDTKDELPKEKDKKPTGPTSGTPGE